MKHAVIAVVALILFGWLVSYWQAILGAVLVGGLVYAAALGVQARWRRRAADRLQEGERQTQLADRAQQQHEQYLAGEDRGVYGIFSPIDPDRPRQGIRRLPSSPGQWRAEP